MRSKILAIVALSLATLVAAPAFAAPSENAASAKTQRAEKEKATYPMPAAAFKQKTDERLAKARTHMEKRAAKLDAEKAKELRTKFDSGVVTVNQEVAKATADGTVTQDEAKSVHHAMHSIKGEHGKHAKKNAKQ